MIEKLTKDEDGRYVDKDGCNWDSRSDYLQIEILGLCGCGNPYEVMLYVKEMFEKLDNSQWEPYENMPYMFFVYWANEEDFAEHGSTARCSWLTDKGKELLKDINSCIEETKGGKK